MTRLNKTTIGLILILIFSMIAGCGDSPTGIDEPDNQSKWVVENGEAVYQGDTSIGGELLPDGVNPEQVDIYAEDYNDSTTPDRYDFEMYIDFNSTTPVDVNVEGYYLAKGTPENVGSITFNTFKSELNAGDSGTVENHGFNVTGFYDCLETVSTEQPITILARDAEKVFYEVTVSSRGLNEAFNAILCE